MSGKSKSFMRRGAARNAQSRLENTEHNPNEDEEIEEDEIVSQDQDQDQDQGQQEHEHIAPKAQHVLPSAPSQSHIVSIFGYLIYPPWLIVFSIYSLVGIVFNFDVQFMTRVNSFFKNTLGLQDPKQVQWTDSAKAMVSLAFWGVILAVAVWFILGQQGIMSGAFDGDLSSVFISIDKVKADLEDVKKASADYVKTSAFEKLKQTVESMGKTLEAHIADVKAVRSGHGSELAAVVSRIDSLEKLVAASADSTTTSSTDTTKIQEELTALSTGLQTLVDRVSGIAASSDERFVSLEGKVISLTEQATGQVVQSSELSEEELDRIVVFVRKSIDIQGSSGQQSVHPASSSREDISAIVREILSDAAFLRQVYNSQFREQVEQQVAASVSSYSSGPGPSVDIDQAAIARMIAAKVEEMSLGGVLEPDFALVKAGARVEPSLTHFTRFLSVLDTGTQFRVEGGPCDCWPFIGPANLTIRLACPATPTKFTIDHISKSRAFHMESAPKQIRVWGRNSINPSEQPEELATFEYDIEGTPAQTFPVAANVAKKAFSLITLEVSNNHGFEYTCLYRFRVHGEKSPECDVQ